MTSRATHTEPTPFCLGAAKCAAAYTNTPQAFVHLWEVIPAHSTVQSNPQQGYVIDPGVCTIAACQRVGPIDTLQSASVTLDWCMQMQDVYMPRHQP